jgi:hypothetical protein
MHISDLARHIASAGPARHSSQRCCLALAAPLPRAARYRRASPASSLRRVARRPSHTHTQRCTAQSAQTPDAHTHSGWRRGRARTAQQVTGELRRLYHRRPSGASPYHRFTRSISRSHLCPRPFRTFGTHSTAAIAEPSLTHRPHRVGVGTPFPLVLPCSPPSPAPRHIGQHLLHLHSSTREPREREPRCVLSMREPRSLACSDDTGHLEDRDKAAEAIL